MPRWVWVFAGEVCLANDRLNGGSVALFLGWAGPNPVREPSSGGTLGRMNDNVRRVWVTLAHARASSVAGAVQPAAHAMRVSSGSICFK